MDIFKCEVCGLIIEVLHESNMSQLIHCDKPMKHMVENTDDSAAKEKHVPVVETQGDGILVKVGEVEHPMVPEHYIEWIEVINGNYVNRYHLKPGEKPQAPFYVSLQPGMIIREYCNIHGLWKKV